MNTPAPQQSSAAPLQHCAAPAALSNSRSTQTSPGPAFGLARPVREIPRGRGLEEAATVPKQWCRAPGTANVLTSTCKLDTDAHASGRVPKTGNPGAQRTPRAKCQPTSPPSDPEDPQQPLTMSLKGPFWVAQSGSFTLKPQSGMLPTVPYQARPPSSEGLAGCTLQMRRGMRSSTRTQSWSPPGRRKLSGMKAVSRDMCRLAWATSICLSSISMACVGFRKGPRGCRPGIPAGTGFQDRPGSFQHHTHTSQSQSHSPACTTLPGQARPCSQHPHS